ncbi:MAG TPA: SbmA/BacA-like family transporter [Gemmataceae bacterium]|nr:SbmA/BacA-like family transporter [Gemmataceae bacterium]
MRFFKSPLWSRLTTIAWPFFVSEAWHKAIGALVILIVLLLAVNGLNIGISYIMRDFMTALEQKHAARFYTFGGLLAGVFAIAAIGEAFSYFTEQQLGLVWREWLTRRLLDRYLANRAYHRLTSNHAIDNPDQRISEDTKTFTTSSLSFIVLILNGLLTLVAFLGVLWSITPWLVLAAILYAAAGSLGTILLGRRLVPLNNQQLQKEADFRFGLGRVREHAGSVAQLSGHGGEKNQLLSKFNALVENFRAIIRVTRNVGFFTKEYNYLIQIIPAMVVAALYIRGQVQFGAIAQSAMAFGQVMGAFSLIVTKFQELSTFAAVTHRLGSMWEATESAEEAAPAGAAEEHPAEVQGPAHIERGTDNHRVVYEKLTLWSPKDKRILLRDLSLEVPEGQRMIVTGPNGSGKTALCLATARLWGQGQGKVITPPADHIKFLPQQVYTASGCLRDLLLYGLDQGDISDDRIRGALRDVGLEGLARQAGGLDIDWDWPNVLSSGDQHALAVARLLLVQPRFAVLDGAPWALESAHLERLYEALAGTSITYITAGGPSLLLPFHDLWLELLGGGKWRVRQTDMPDDENAAVPEGVSTHGQK